MLTLPWPDPARPLPESLETWERALARFVSEGRGWFDLTQARGALDASGAMHVVLVGEKALADRLAGRAAGPLSTVFSALPEELLPELDDAFSRCQEALLSQVNPLLALDAMAARLHRLVRTGAKARA